MTLYAVCSTHAGSQMKGLDGIYETRDEAERMMKWHRIHNFDDGLWRIEEIHTLDADTIYRNHIGHLNLTIHLLERQLRRKLR